MRSQRRQCFALGLADIEDMYNPEADGNRGRRRLNLFLPIVLRLSSEGYWCQDGNALLALSDAAAKALPGLKARNLAGARSLQPDQETVVQGILMEAGCEAEILPKSLRVLHFLD